VKKLLAGIAGIVAFSSLAPIAFAPYNDVTLTTSAVLSVNGITLNISGSSSVIERPIAGHSPDIRRAVRHRTARPRIDELGTWLDEQLNKLPGKSDLAAAIRYARSRWGALTRYLDDGRLEISNNAAENQIRPAALGRKNTGRQRLAETPGLGVGCAPRCFRGHPK
jgi:hypothetical protein